MRSRVCMLLLVVAVVCRGGSRVSHAAEDLAIALKEAGVDGGLIVQLDCGDGGDTASLLLDDRFVVQGLSKDRADVMRARQRLNALGVYGQVTVREYDGQQLPYADNLVNAIVAENRADVPREEVLRVLAPAGVALIDGQRLTKPWPDDIDQWTHFLHGPDNNAVGRDRIVAAPRSIQWVSTPLWGRSHEELASMSAAVSAQGRAFFIIDEAPLATIRFSGDWSLVARNAFNGVLLWKRGIPQWIDHLRHFRSGPAHLSRRLVAVDDVVYVTLGLAAPVVALDAASGDTLRVYDGTQHTEEILVEGTRLYLVIGTSEVHRTGAGLYRRGEPAATARRFIKAVDINTGGEQWKHEFGDNEFLLPLSLAVKDESVVYQSTAGVTCLEAASGATKWHAARATPRRRMGFSAPTVVMANGVVLCADRDVDQQGEAARDIVQWGVNGWNEPGFVRNGKGTLRAYRVENGEVLWSAACTEGYNSPVDVFVVDNTVWVGSDYRRYDLMTGEEKDRLTWNVGSVAMGHHRCYRNKASEKYLFTGRAGIEVVDLETGWVGNNSWLRGTCQFGIMPANGLLYVPPDACACVPKAKLPGIFAAAPKRSRASHRESPEEGRLERGSGFLKLADRIPDLNVDSDISWPMYRHDATRSGAVRSSLPPDLKPIWTAEYAGSTTQPVSASDRTFVAVIDAHTVHALDSRSGRELWSYTAGGRIDSAPTVYQNLLLFGCADGWVYACRTRDGRLAWRFRAAPLDRQICAFGQLASVWPSHGSVLVQNHSLYVTAGRSTYLDGGIVLYRLHPITGQQLSRTVVTHIDPVTDKQTGAEDRTLYGFDMEGVTTDILSGDGESVFLKHLHFDANAKEIPRTKPHLFSITGFLVEDWFVRTYWLLGTDVGAGWGGWAQAAGTAPSGRILSFDQRVVCGYGRKAVQGGRAGHRANDYQLFCEEYSTPAPTSAEEAASRRRRGQATAEHAVWTDDQSLMVRAMVLADDKLVVAGPPEPGPEAADSLRYLDEAEARATFHGKRGVFLQVRSVDDGRVLSQYELAAMPVFDGMSVADGRLFVALKNGHVVCFAGQDAVR